MNKYTAFNHVSQCRDSVSQEQVAATAAEWAAHAETVKVTQAGSRCVAGRIATINQWCSIPSAPGWWSQSYCHLIADTTYELSLETDKVWSPATLAEADIADCDELTPDQCDALDAEFEALVAASDAYQKESIA